MLFLYLLLPLLDANKDVHGDNLCTLCTVPKVSDVLFCGVLSHSVCQNGTTSFTEQDTLVERSYISWKRDGNILQNTNATFQNACSSSLLKITCAASFRVCEDNHAMPLCAEACRLEMTSCENETLTDAICASFKSENSCVNLEYSTSPDSSKWIVGVLIAVLFSFFSSVGINLQKRAISANELQVTLHGTKRKAVYKLPLWNFGFTLIIMGSILDFVAFGFAPQSLLAPLGALTLVWNMMLAPCFNKERLDRRDIVSTLVIFLGAIVAVLFASKGTPNYSLQDLKQLYADPITGTHSSRIISCKLILCLVSYFIIIFFVMVAHFAAIRIIEKLDLATPTHHVMWTRVHMISYSGVAGLMGGQSVLFAKSVAEIVKSFLRGEHPYVHFEMYLLVLALIVCLVTQIHFLNGGLRYHDALSIVPTYQAYWIISGVLGGCVYFQEIKTYSLLQSLMFTLGILITIVGVVLLAQRKSTGLDKEPLPTSRSGKEELENYVTNMAIANYLDASPRVSVGDILFDMRSGLFISRRRSTRRASSNGSLSTLPEESVVAKTGMLSPIAANSFAKSDDEIRDAV